MMPGAKQCDDKQQLEFTESFHIFQLKWEKNKIPQKLIIRRWQQILQSSAPKISIIEKTNHAQKPDEFHSKIHPQIPHNNQLMPCA